MRGEKWEVAVHFSLLTSPFLLLTFYFLLRLTAPSGEEPKQTIFIFAPLGESLLQLHQERMFGCSE
jgi:hypothetical protein